MVVYVDRQKESPAVVDHHSPCRIVAISAAAHVSRHLPRASVMRGHKIAVIVREHSDLEPCPQTSPLQYRIGTISQRCAKSSWNIVLEYRPGDVLNRPGISSWRCVISPWICA